jgi:hypothetical protein
MEGESTARRPWQDLPPDTFDSLAPLLPAIADEIIETIRREVPDYSRPLTGTFGRTVRLGVEQALEQFAALVREPGSTRATAREVYVQLGRGELLAGRSIGTLLAAYRVGARVAWRRLAAAGLDAGLSQETLNRLAESIFAYIDELSAESAEGYALAQAAQAGEADRRRAELLGLLMRSDRPPDPEALAAAAQAADWRLPTDLAVVVWRDGETGLTPLLPDGSIAGEVEQPGGDQLGCAVVPDALGPGRRRQLRDALTGIAAGVGTVTAPGAAAHSFRHAVAAFGLAQERALAQPLFADEHYTDLLARADPQLAADARAHYLAVLDGETPGSRERLQATLLAWLRHDGNVPSAAAELHVHPQTLRYRLARLRELFGEVLDEPDARFAIEVALRAAAHPPSGVRSGPV